MTDTSAPAADPGSAASAASAARWRALLRGALVLLFVVGVLVHVAVQVPIPPVIVFMVVFAIALYLLTREGRARTVGVVLGGVGAALFLLGNLPFVIDDLQHPDSFIGFLTSGAGSVGAVVGLVAMLGTLLHWGDAPVRPLGIVAGALVAVVAVIGVVATIGATSDDRQPGDVVLVAKDADYVTPGSNRNGDVKAADPAKITVDAGSGAVFVKNEDLFRHTFTIEALHIDEELPASKSIRVPIDAPPRDYPFKCSVEGHDDMRGTLTVR
jgi:plastocyanin